MDLYAYPGKNIANSFITIKGRCQFDDNTIQHPIAILSLCLPHQTNDQDSFLSFESVLMCFYIITRSLLSSMN